jgi:hypothetical protein
MTHHTYRLRAAVTFAMFVLALLPSAAGAETVVCRSLTSTVKAVTIAEDYFPVTALFQGSRANLQPLLETTVTVGGTGASCVVATFSAVVTPSDNYVVFQVTLDGVPMHGHTVFYAQPSTPVVIEMEETDLNQPRMIAHQFFLRADPGVHTVRVSVAQGSGPGPYNSTVEAPVLSIQY